jgi:NAD(P)-dependent dehydrogenase (short-subunit alcohol dehydrogenase family)
VSGVLAGKTAFITGGGGAIGSESALHLVRDGAAVLLMGRRAGVLERARDRILKEVPDGRVEIFSGDAGELADIRAAIDAALAIQGSLDIVVTTVGGGEFRPFLMLDLESFNEQFTYNFTTAFLAIRYAIPKMGRGGAVVAISSTAAGNCTPWMVAYMAAKGALEQMIRGVAEELGSAGIRANVVRPGLVRTELGEHPSEDDRVYRAVTAETPLGRTGVPTDIADAVRFLAGPESSWMTGQIFAVDGGAELRKNPPLEDIAREFHGDAAIDAVLAGKEPGMGN